MHPPEEDLYTYTEAARILKVCVNTVRKLVARGDLDGIRISERVVRVRLRKYLSRSSK